MVGIFLIGAIIFIGFVGTYLFERTKIPDVLLLMVIGILLGPVFRIVDVNFLFPLAPFFGAVALIVILFDGGLNMNLFKVIGELAPATVFTVLCFLGCVAATGAILTWGFGWNVWHALLLGVILGGTASNVVIPIVSKLTVSDEAKTILSLESALNDTLTIVGAIALVEVIATNSVNVQSVSNAILGAFSIAAVAGVVAGIVWLKFLEYFHEKSFGYMLTLAALFVLYAAVESVKANGAIAVLVFGLLLGSSSQLMRFIDGKKKPLEMEGPLKRFHTEISFFIRTFFFVYTGILLDLAAITAPVAVVSLAVLVGLFASRRLVVELFSRFSRKIEPYKMLMTVMMPRGLAMAVLISIPSSRGIQVPGFEAIGLLILLLTNLLATVGIFAYERGKGLARPALFSAASRPRVLSQKVKR